MTTEFKNREFILSHNADPIVIPKIEKALKSIYDPEIPVDIWEFGLVYKVRVGRDNRVLVEMTLTTPLCPVADSMPKWVQEKVEAIEEIPSCFVSLVWEPKFTIEMMSEEARLELDML